MLAKSQVFYENLWKSGKYDFFCMSLFKCSFRSFYGENITQPWCINMYFCFVNIILYFKILLIKIMIPANMDDAILYLWITDNKKQSYNCSKMQSFIMEKVLSSFVKVPLSSINAAPNTTERTRNALFLHSSSAYCLLLQ